MEVITETKLALKNDKRVAMVSLDIRKHFDQTPRDGLKIKLQTIEWKMLLRKDASMKLESLKDLC